MRTSTLASSWGYLTELSLIKLLLLYIITIYNLKYTNPGQHFPFTRENPFQTQKVKAQPSAFSLQQCIFRMPKMPSRILIHFPSNSGSFPTPLSPPRHPSPDGQPRHLHIFSNKFFSLKKYNNTRQRQIFRCKVQHNIIIE